MRTEGFREAFDFFRVETVDLPNQFTVRGIVEVETGVQVALADFMLFADGFFNWKATFCFFDMG